MTVAPHALVLVLAGLAPAASQQSSHAWDVAKLRQISDRVMAQVAELRGEDYRAEVPVQVATPDDFKEYVEKMEDEIFPPDYSDASEVMMKMLGLLDPEFDVQAATKAMLEKMVAGYYDPFSKSFYLCDIVEPGTETVFLAHELTHALDDQLFDLAGGLRSRVGNSDELLAYRAVVEGSGTNLMAVWLSENMDSVDLGKVLALQTESMDGMADLPVVLWQPLLWAYNGGADFLVQSETPGRGQQELASGDVIRSVFSDPPVSTEQVLHPRKYWDAENRDLPVPIELETGELPSGWSARLEDTLGELTMAQLTMPMDERQRGVDNPMALLTLEPTNVYAEGWGGDRAVLLENENGDRIVHSASVWDSERDAGEFLAAMRMLAPAIEQNARGFLPESRRKRKSASGVDVRYGERRDEVLVTVWYGAGRTTVRKVVGSIGVRVGE